MIDAGLASSSERIVEETIEIFEMDSDNSFTPGKENHLDRVSRINRNSEKYKRKES